MSDVRYAPINEWLDTFDISVLPDLNKTVINSIWGEPIIKSLVYEKFTFNLKIDGEFVIYYEYEKKKIIRLRFLVKNERTILHKRIKGNGDYLHTMEHYIHDLINEEDYFQQSTIRKINFTWEEINSFCKIMDTVLPYLK